MKRACRILSINVEVHGMPSPIQDTLFVANHISWIDIIALASFLDARFIAKDDVKSWPLIGWMASLSGNLFIERNRPTCMKSLIENVCGVLKKYNAIVLFPEGTTTDGMSVNRFYPGLFSSVAYSEHVVQPIALYYQRNGAIDEFSPYIGEDNFISHLFQICSFKSTEVKINLGISFLPISMDRHEIASQAYSDIVGMLNRQRGITPVKLSWAA